MLTEILLRYQAAQSSWGEPLAVVTQARSVLAGLAQRLSEQSRAHQEHFQQAEQTSVDLFRAVEQQLEEQKRMVARQLLEAFDAGRTVLADRSAEVDAVSRRLLDLGNALQTLEPSERNLERFCSYCN